MSQENERRFIQIDASQEAEVQAFVESLKKSKAEALALTNGNHEVENETNFTLVENRRASASRRSSKKHSFETISENDVEKRSSSFDGAFNEAVCNRNMFVVAEKFPEETLTTSDHETFESYLMKRILLAPKGAGPKFERRELEKDGCMRFVCIGNQTVEFLDNVVQGYIGEKKIKLVALKDMPQAPTYSVMLTENKDRGLNFSQFLQFIASQNSWVDESKWKLLENYRLSGGAKIFLVSVDEEQKIHIEGNKRKLYFRLNSLYLMPKKMEDVEDSTKILDAGDLKNNIRRRSSLSNWRSSIKPVKQ